MKQKIRIFLKSGANFAFFCDSMKVRSLDNELIGYSVEGMSEPSLLYCRVHDISAIVVEGEEVEDG